MENLNIKEHNIVVSMTSTHSRIKDVHLTISSILSQKLRADQVILWLSKEAYLLDNGVSEDDIPSELLDLKSKGLEIRWTKNTGPYRKLIPTLELKKGSNDLIISADDDVIYPDNWIEGLYREYTKHPDCVICYRGRLISKKRPGKLASYIDWRRTFELDELELGPNKLVFPTGKDGVLYPIKSLSDEIFNEDFMELATTNDDIWFKAMTLLTGTNVRCLSGHKDFEEIESSRDSRLFQKNKKNNDKMIKTVFEKYDLMEIL